MEDDRDERTPGASASPGLRSAISGIEGPSYASYATAVVNARARLRRMFEIDIVNGPAFDMLLRIFAANEANNAISITALGAAAGVPHASTARWVRALEDNGIVQRKQDPNDHRRSELALTSRAESVLRDWLAAISSIPLRRE